MASGTVQTIAKISEPGQDVLSIVETSIESGGVDLGAVGPPISQPRHDVVKQRVIDDVKCHVHGR